MGQQIDVIDLSFVSRHRRNRALDRRLFWKVKATGDYGKDIDAGQRLALEWLSYEAQPVSGPILNLIVEDMPRPLTGVEIGFLSVVTAAAQCGASQARQLVASWPKAEDMERCL